jgi:hypothetical protein
VIRGRRAITPDTSLRLARYFGFSPGYWHNLQKHYEFELARRSFEGRIAREVRPRRAAGAFVRRQTAAHAPRAGRYSDLRVHNRAIKDKQTLENLVWD